MSPATNSSTPQQTMTSGIPAKRGLSALPPELIQKILVQMFHPTHSYAEGLSATLTAQNEDMFANLDTIPYLSLLLRETIEAIDIDWTSTMPRHTLTQLSPYIKSLSITRHSLATSYITALQNTSLRSLHLSEVTVRPFLHILSRSAPKLKELSLSFVTTTIRPVKNLALENLSFSGMPNLTHHALTGLLSIHLKRLHLSYLRHKSINDNTLSTIARHNLTHLTLAHLRHCTPEGISSLLTHIQGLHALTLTATRIYSNALTNFLKSAENLKHLSLEEPSWITARTESFMEKLSNKLTSFELRDVPGVTDHDMYRLACRMPNLQTLSLRRHPLLTDLAVPHLATLPLKKLNLRGVLVSDVFLLYLSHLSLHELALGGDGRPVPPALVASARGVTNAGMEVLLRRSPNLKKFFWETPRMLFGELQVMTVCLVNGLHAKKLAELLKQFCMKLEKVEINWLRPRSVDSTSRVEAARCDLAFLELEEATGAVVLVDERPLY